MSARLRPVRLDPPPEVQILGDALVVRGRAALDLYRLVHEGVRVSRTRDGIEPSPRLLRLLAATTAAAAAARASADAADIADVRIGSPVQPLRNGQQIEIEEVAEMLGVGVRQARRLATELGGRKTRSGRWSFDSGEVQAHLAHHHHTTRSPS